MRKAFQHSKEDFIKREEFKGDNIFQQGPKSGNLSHDISVRAGRADHILKNSAALGGLAPEPPVLPPAQPTGGGGGAGRSVDTMDTRSGWQYSCTAVISPAGTAEYS